MRQDKTPEEEAMAIRGSRTEELLRTALADELQSSTAYRHLAAAAKEAGQDLISDLLTAMARNEGEHADHEFRFLGEHRDLRASIEAAAELERKGSGEFYPAAAEIAEREGLSDVADFFRVAARAEVRHEKRLRAALQALEEGRPPEGRTVLHSAVDMAQIMLPGQANPAGFVHGGELMKLMDNAAGVAAVRHCHSSVVTAMVEELHFLHPVRIGSLVLLHSRLTYVGNSSMEVLVEVDTEDIATETCWRAVTAHFVMIALDRDRKPARVPPLIVCTEEEERLFDEAHRRYLARKAGRENA
jgi:acyl-CoA hydrolase/ferritin